MLKGVISGSLIGSRGLGAVGAHLPPGKKLRVRRGCHGRARAAAADSKVEPIAEPAAVAEAVAVAESAAVAAVEDSSAAAEKVVELEERKPKRKRRRRRRVAEEGSAELGL